MPFLCATVTKLQDQAVYEQDKDEAGSPEKGPCFQDATSSEDPDVADAGSLGKPQSVEDNWGLFLEDPLSPCWFTLPHFHALTHAELARKILYPLSWL